MAHVGRLLKGAKADDEYYTLYEDIEKEVVKYKDSIQGKTIYMPCDNPSTSNFWKYFTDHFEEYNLKAIIATTYGSNQVIATTKEQTRFYNIDDFEGDFRSEISKTIMKQVDLVITNPPFSLFNDFILQMHEAGCDYLVIGSLSAISMMNIFPLWKNNSLRAGYTKPKKFLQPSGEYRNFGNCCWYTTLPTETSKEVLPEKEQDIGTYNRYWNCEAIDVPKLSEIPAGYEGLMGVPLTYIFHHNQDLYDVVGIDRFTDCVRPIGKEWCKLYRSQGGKAHLSDGMRVLVMIDKEGKAKSVFKRIIIKKCSKHK